MTNQSVWLSRLDISHFTCETSLSAMWTMLLMIIGNVIRLISNEEIFLWILLKFRFFKIYHNCNENNWNYWYNMELCSVNEKRTLGKLNIAFMFSSAKLAPLQVHWHFLQKIIAIDEKWIFMMWNMYFDTFFFESH